MSKKSTEPRPEPLRTEQTPTTPTPVVAMPKFNPYERPGAMQEPDPTPIRQSCEDVQREAKGPGSEEWRKADKLRSDLIGLYDSLRDDSRYTDEYKSETAWKRYEETRAKVEELAPLARQRMLRSAETAEVFSIPTPQGEGLSTKDTTKLLLTQGERSRLEGLLNRAEKQAKGPFRTDPASILRGEYERGLGEGGPGGGATVRAVVQLARDYGLDVDAIVDTHRKPHHHGAIGDAQAARMRASMVGRSVPQPPFPHPNQIRQTSERSGTYGSDAKAFIPQQRGMFAPKRRRASWK